MSKPVKDLITAEYKKLYGDLNSACVVSVVGLDAVSTNRFRGELRSKDIQLRVIKNSLARRAFVDGPLAPLAEALDGPCALVIGAESAIDLAKVLAECQKSYPEIELKQGMLDGDPQLIAVSELAKMKNRTENLAELAMLIASPGRNLAGCLVSPGGRVAGCLKAIADKADKEEEVSQAA